MIRQLLSLVTCLVAFGFAGCSTCRTTHDYDGPVYCDDLCGHCGQCGDPLARAGSILSPGGHVYDGSTYEPSLLPQEPGQFDEGPTLEDYRPEDFPAGDDDLIPINSSLPAMPLGHTTTSGKVGREKVVEQAQYKAPMKLRR